MDQTILSSQSPLCALDHGAKQSIAIGTTVFRLKVGKIMEVICLDDGLSALQQLGMA